MLIRSQVINMIKGRYDSGSLFSLLPQEIIRQIKYSSTPDQDFLDALKDTADGKLEELRAKLKKNPRLLLQAGDVVTPAGLLLCNTTILECAIGSGDTEMIVMIKPYFFNLPGGEEAMEDQIERYRPCIEGIQNQKPDDLTWLIPIIRQSSFADVAAELATGANYDKKYQSSLRNALNKFREEKLNPKHRVITKPKMHWKYQNLVHAFEIRDREFKNLIEGNNAVVNYMEKIILIDRQIIGFIELVESPSYERFVFAQAQIQDAILCKSIVRSPKFKHGNGLFPCFDATLVDSRSGIGFDSVATFFYGKASGIGCGSAGGSFLKNFWDVNTWNLLNNLCRHTHKPSRSL